LSVGGGRDLPHGADLWRLKYQTCPQRARTPRPHRCFNYPGAAQPELPAAAPRSRRKLGNKKPIRQKDKTSGRALPEVSEVYQKVAKEFIGYPETIIDDSIT
jgi:hypothetical protein